MKKNNSGLTLIEILISLSLLGMLALISIPAYQVFISDENMDATKSNLTQIIRKAQVSSYNGLQDESYGIFIDFSSTPNKYILFKGSTYNPGDADNETYELPKNIVFKNLDLGGSSKITFDKYSIIPRENGSISLENNKGEESVVYITSYGTIYSD